MLENIYLHVAAVALVAAGFCIALWAGFLAITAACGVLAYLRALTSQPAAPETTSTPQ